jgi:hypothetical protein
MAPSPPLQILGDRLTLSKSHPSDSRPKGEWGSWQMKSYISRADEQNLISSHHLMPTGDSLILLGELRVIRISPLFFETVDFGFELTI